MDKTFLLNFGHPLASAAVTSLLELLELGEAQLVEQRVSLQLDMDAGAEPTTVQVRRVIDQAAEDVKQAGGALDGTCAVVLALPGLTEGTALILAELHGRLGTFPRVLALRRLANGTYGLANAGRYPGMRGGLLDLERVRQAARERR